MSEIRPDTGHDQAGPYRRIEIDWASNVASVHLEDRRFSAIAKYLVRSSESLPSAAIQPTPRLWERNG
jgi:hypothetical protein